MAPHSSIPSCSPPGCPFPVKSLALSAHVSPQTIYFRVLDKSPLQALEGVPLPATETVAELLSWASKSLWTGTAATKLKDACSLEEKL